MTASPDPKYTWEYELRWYYNYFHWFHFLVLIVPLIPLAIALQNVSFHRNTLWLTVALYFMGCISLTAGYHRLWAHRSYQACTPLRYLIAFIGAGQFQWSIAWWVYHHRAHHRYTDTHRDPQNARRGFFFCHIGWLIGYNPKSWGKADISDVLADPVVVWQQKYYVILAAFSAIFIPTAIAYWFWDDAIGALVYAFGVRLVLNLHATFFVNSLSHAPWAGSQPYSNAQSARNVPLLALITGGEGSHNFHHTFPTDYRHGESWLELDSTRLVLHLWRVLGLVWDLKTVSAAEIKAARQRQIQGDTGANEAVCIPETSRLRHMDCNSYVNQTSYGRGLIAIKGLVYDVSEFLHHHPGGPELLQDTIGKDATVVFTDHHQHSPHAEALLATMCIAKLQGHLDAQ